MLLLEWSRPHLAAPAGGQARSELRRLLLLELSLAAVAWTRVGPALYTCCDTEWLPSATSPQK